MAVTLCPWCQSEIPHEEGTEPEKWCPVCDNELDGYRTIKLGLGDEEEEEEEEPEQDRDAGIYNDTENLGWSDDGELREKNEALLQYEETVEALLDEQEAVPECPQCREYMLEAGEQRISADIFRSRMLESLGEPVLKTPYSLTVYVCPSCFHVLHTLSEEGRSDMALRLSRAGQNGKKGSKS